MFDASLSCIFPWSFKASNFENLLSHSEQLKGFSSGCGAFCSLDTHISSSLWLLDSLKSLKLLLQIGQLNSFLLWIFLCFLKSLIWEKLSSQITQLRILFWQYIPSCSSNLSVEANILSHFSRELLVAVVAPNLRGWVVYRTKFQSAITLRVSQ